ncbi:MAG TPA: sugar transferase [Candidatus Saccharimonadales bacterium]|nr:sugar transferase [Candidatus Saccharimonadales bacterium]
MRNNASLVYRVVLVLGDYLTLIGAFFVAYIIRVRHDPRPLIQQIPAEKYLLSILLVLPLWIIIHGAIGLYSRTATENRFAELGKLIMGSILGILAVVGYDFVLNNALFPARLVVVYAFVLGFTFLIIFRTLARKTRSILYSYNIGIANLLIVGSGKRAKNVINQFIDTSATGYRIIGIVGEEQKDFPEIPGFNDLEQARKKLKLSNIHSIFQSTLYKSEEKNSEVVSFAQENHIEFRFIPGGSELYSGNIEVELFREIPAVMVHQTALIGWGRIVKRIFDVVVGAIFFIIASPFMLLTAVLIKLASPRQKILFKQTRLTQFNKPFTVYKFRSQSQRFDGTTPEEAFRMLGQPELAKKYRDNGDYLENDPRVSSLGKFLRLTSLDELPQLFNVLKGDISLVGPRALVPEELEKYRQKHHILSVKSGMTGLAQVSGRLNISFEERRRLDMYYVQNWNFWMDIVILLRTFRTVLGGKGAK